MKKILLLLTVLLGFVPSYTQEYTNPENVWIYDYLGLEERYYVQTWGEDTMINGEVVKTLVREKYQVFRDSWTGEILSVYGPYGGGYINIKMIEGEVYIYNVERNAFEFVFDLNANVGDTWDLITYFDYQCYEMEPFHIAYTSIVDEIATREGEQGPLEYMNLKILNDDGSNNNAWYNSRVYRSIGPSTYYTICVEPLDILDDNPAYANCTTDYCFGTIAGLRYFSDENGAHINNLEPEILSEMLSIHNETKPQLEFTVSPNPVNDILNIQTDLHISNVMIYNAQGKHVLEQNGNATQMIVSSLPEGVYFVVVKTDEGIDGTQKFIKK